MSTAPTFTVTRRGWLQLTATGVAASAWPDRGFANDVAGPGAGRAKSVVLVLLSGGPSQLDTFDPKPDAPAEIRGEFGAITTCVPGLSLCEHLPGLASRMQHWAVVRTLSHKGHNHLLATHVALTGRPTPIPRGGSDLDRVQSRSDFPNFAAALNYVRPRSDGAPTGVSLPNYLIEGPLTWPGQHAGFLGVKHDPWVINQDPNDPGFRVEALQLPAEVGVGRIAARRSLLAGLSAAELESPRSRAFLDNQQNAFALLSAAQVSQAFRIVDEPDAVRDRYGRNKFGQSLLLARRLVEAGVPIIQAAMGIVQTWDTHVDNWGRLKNTLLPQLDRGLGALLDDLAASGRLGETLVLVLGEFGRTPRISTLPGQTIPGRDHWAHVYSGLFAGAGVRGGQVLGRSDDIAAYPVSRTWSPADVGSTLLNALGVRPDAEIYDPLGRPNRLLNGEVMEPLYSGAPA